MAYSALRFSPRGEQIDKEEPFFEFDERCHLELIAELETSQTTFPLLARLRDPYGDADFHSGEIPALTVEARRLATEAPSETLRKELTRFADTLQTLAGQSANLCFLGD